MNHEIIPFYDQEQDILMEDAVLETVLWKYCFSHSPQKDATG